MESSKEMVNVYYEDAYWIFLSIKNCLFCIKPHTSACNLKHFKHLSNVISKMSEYFSFCSKKYQ